MKKTKQIKNRKDVRQNLRNRLVNRRYTGLIKKVSKEYRNFLFSLQSSSKNFRKTKLQEKNLVLSPLSPEQKEKATVFLRKLISLFDKATKKKVMHRNAAARKKSAVQKFFNKLN